MPPSKYPPFLDPIKEDYKKERHALMGKTKKCFAPHAFEDRFEYDKNVFSMSLRDTVCEEASYPRFFVCHMCGGSYGWSSLQLHFRVCEKMWDAREAEREEGEPQRPVPSKPSFSPTSGDPENGNTWSREDINEYNTAAQEIYDEDACIKCERCGRKFREESFATHYAGCDKPENPDAVIQPCNLCGKLLFGAEHRLKHKRKCRSNLWDMPTATMKTGLACYVCGKEFSEGSIERHITTCEKLWIMRENDKLYPDERLPLPPKIAPNPGADNAQRIELKKQCMLGCGAMKKCENCNRCFFAESYEKHIRGCGQEQTLENFLKEEKKKKTMKKIGPDGFFRKYVAKPKEMGTCCYICGRKFGTWSIEIHVKACIELWEKREAAKPEREVKLPVPARPKQFDDWKSKSMSNSDYNKWVVENCGLYLPCDRCGRTFLPDQLEKHRKGCKEQGARSEWRC